MSIVHTDRDNKSGVCFGGVFGAGGTRTCLHNQFSPSVEQLSWGTGRQSRSRGVGVIGSCAAVCTRGRECDACAVRRHLPPSLPPTPTNVPSARTRFCAASCSMLNRELRFFTCLMLSLLLCSLSHVVVAVLCAPAGSLHVLLCHRCACSGIRPNRQRQRSLQRPVCRTQPLPRAKCEAQRCTCVDTSHQRCTCVWRTHSSARADLPAHTCNSKVWALEHSSREAGAALEGAPLCKVASEATHLPTWMDKRPWWCCCS